MRKIIKIFLLLFLFLNIANGYDIKNLGSINSSVIDKVGVLNDTQKTEIEAKIQEIRNKYTVEILTIIIPTTDGEDISSVAIQIGQEIGVGKSDKDNGLVLLIAINDRSWNISTGYGVEGVLPDLLTKKIGEKNFVLFKNSKYSDGIIGALNDFERAFSGDKSIISEMGEKTQKEPGYFIAQVIFAYILSLIFLKSFYKLKKYKKLFLYLLIFYIITLPIAYILLNNIFFWLENIGVWLIGSIFGIFGKNTGVLGNRNGGGGNSSGGGFGGFSGGSFGGGGSSGKW